MHHVILHSKHVRVNNNNLSELAVKYSKEELLLPRWDAPVFLEASVTSSKDTLNQVADFMILGNTINFAYTNFSTGIDYAHSYKGIGWRGAFGMWSALKNAFEEGKPILDGGYLSTLKLGDMKEIFEPSKLTLQTMPMIKERAKILREVGKMLTEKYDGHFHNMLTKSDGRIFDANKGFIRMLLNDFPSFRDRAIYKGQEVVFNKRAQLATFMLYEKLLGTSFSPLFVQEDVDKLTVAADYELPKVLHIVGVLEYQPDLEKKIKKGRLIKAGSEEEVEIRANTTYASEQIKDLINSMRDSSRRVNALHIDYRLWKEGEGRTDVKHHLTKTTAY
ncbi:MAG: queuosine salvage family protein [Candidatus Micrarchaeales archaeon]